MKIIKNFGRWLSQPAYYFRKANWRLLGRNLDFLDGSRDHYPPGTIPWLALTELKYGGFQDGGANSRLCQGGDRMSPFHHDYAPDYARFLKPWLSHAGPLTLIEIGILNGTGLALWCDLFPKARIIGLDIDTSNFHAHLPRLRHLGAFSQNIPEVHFFDQLDPAQMNRTLKSVLASDHANIVIDDGCHSIESIEKTFAALLPFLASRYTYFIEDNREAYRTMKHLHPKLRWLPRDELTICLPPR